MSCPGGICGHGGLSLIPVLDPQARMAEGAAMDSLERTTRQTHVLTVSAPVETLPTRIVVPASLRDAKRAPPRR